MATTSSDQSQTWILCKACGSRRLRALDKGQCGFCFNQYKRWMPNGKLDFVRMKKALKQMVIKPKRGEERIEVELKAMRMLMRPIRISYADIQRAKK